MVDPVTFAVTEVSHYAEMVRKARRLRQSVVGRRVQSIGPGKTTSVPLAYGFFWKVFSMAGSMRGSTARF